MKRVFSAFQKACAARVWERIVSSQLEATGATELFLGEEPPEVGRDCFGVWRAVDGHIVNAPEG